MGPLVFGFVTDAVSSSAALLVSGLWALAAAGMNVVGRLMQTRQTSREATPHP